MLIPGAGPAIAKVLVEPTLDLFKQRLRNDAPMFALSHPPFKVQADPDDVAVDPYGPESPDFVVGDDFAHMWCSALAFCQKRFEGKMRFYKNEPSGGIGAFTPDSFPIFDVFRENCYFIADSNHGYKLIGVGKLVAEEVASDRKTALLEPFRFSRYAEGKLHPISNSPFPWS